MTMKKIKVRISGHESETAYIKLPGHSNETVIGIVKKTISLDDLIDAYKGPRVILDFDENDMLIGIEILA
jgi:hypothetical protein